MAECERLHLSAYEMSKIAMHNFEVAKEGDALLIKRFDDQMEAEDQLRRSRSEIESINIRFSSIERELKIRNEMVETLKQELEQRTAEYDTACDALCDMSEMSKETQMVTDDTASTSTIQEADIGHGHVSIQGRPGKSKIIYSRGIMPGPRRPRVLSCLSRCSRQAA